jgi:hypothetical protein
MVYVKFLERKLEHIRCRFSFNSVFIYFFVFYVYDDTNTIEIYNGKLI